MSAGREQALAADAGAPHALYPIIHIPPVTNTTTGRRAEACWVMRRAFIFANMCTMLCVWRNPTERASDARRKARRSCVRRRRRESARMSAPGTSPSRARQAGTGPQSCVACHRTPARAAPAATRGRATPPMARYEPSVCPGRAQVQVRRRRRRAGGEALLVGGPPHPRGHVVEDNDLEEGWKQYDREHPQPRKLEHPPVAVGGRPVRAVS